MGSPPPTAGQQVHGCKGLRAGAPAAELVGGLEPQRCSRVPIAPGTVRCLWG